MKTIKFFKDEVNVLCIITNIRHSDHFDLYLSFDLIIHMQLSKFSLKTIPLEMNARTLSQLLTMFKDGYGYKVPLFKKRVQPTREISSLDHYLEVSWLDQNRLVEVRYSDADGENYVSFSKNLSRYECYQLHHSLLEQCKEVFGEENFLQRHT